VRSRGATDASPQSRTIVVTVSHAAYRLMEQSKRPSRSIGVPGRDKIASSNARHCLPGCGEIQAAHFGTRPAGIERRPMVGTTKRATSVGTPAEPNVRQLEPHQRLVDQVDTVRQVA
jgi:hypothetical protein